MKRWKTRRNSAPKASMNVSAPEKLVSLSTVVDDTSRAYSSSVSNRLTVCFEEVRRHTGIQRTADNGWIANWLGMCILQEKRGFLLILGQRYQRQSVVCPLVVGLFNQ